MKAIRGAISVDSNTPQAIAEATQVLLTEIQRRNRLSPNEIVSVFFSVTPDLNADFPARAAREMGWDVPMLDMQEMDVPGALKCCLRVLAHVDRSRPVTHAYLKDARRLRPDLDQNA